MGPHVNALQIKRTGDAGSTVVQAPDQEPRAGVQGSLLLIFFMESSQKISLKSSERTLQGDEKSLENSARWSVS
jgi:hypothetical protein